MLRHRKAASTGADDGGVREPLLAGGRDSDDEEEESPTAVAKNRNHHHHHHPASPTSKSAPERFFLDFLYAMADLTGLNLVSDVSAEEVQWMEPLKVHAATPFDISDPEHKAALQRLWTVGGTPGMNLDWSEPESHASDEWKKLGFQGRNPATDFRGGGAFSLRNLLYLAETRPDHFKRELHDPSGLPLAIAGINITMMLLHLLQLTTAKTCFSTSHKASQCTTKVARRQLTRILLARARRAGTDLDENRPPADQHDFAAELEKGFGEVYCLAFALLSRLWKEENGNIMEFNSILLKCKTALEAKLRFATSLDDMMP